MRIHNLSKDVLFVLLIGRHSHNELTTVNEIIANKGAHDVIVDFSTVEIVNSLTIGKLLELRELLRQRGRRLILCKVGLLCRCIFRVIGLRSFFDFAEDKFAALAALQHAD